MLMSTNSYLEFYLSLLAWIINNGIWSVLSDTGCSAAPFGAIILQEWLSARPARRRRRQQRTALGAAYREPVVAGLHRRVVRVRARLFSLSLASNCVRRCGQPALRRERGQYGGNRLGRHLQYHR